jgi:hypothetical protein
MKINRKRPSFRYVFLPQKSPSANFDKIAGWATLWAIFSQTQLVALLAMLNLS